ncbi:Hypothetical protein, putative [Bodo saltans]|uniref:Uncharacterized protein n=1 Tax=Bodo saltans TaxID=75058 RepID=A0A0S4J2B1_BODSA|nr:Hypothetical protein, putative [Bodo saltans]|eukprot:CUG67161.1 Hypothetical protein, putative [Bodo saltans]
MSQYATTADATGWVAGALNNVTLGDVYAARWLAGAAIFNVTRGDIASASECFYTPAVRRLLDALSRYASKPDTVEMIASAIFNVTRGPDGSALDCSCSPSMHTALIDMSRYATTSDVGLRNERTLQLHPSASRIGIAFCSPPVQDA